MSSPTLAPPLKRACRQRGAAACLPLEDDCVAPWPSASAGAAARGASRSPVLLLSNSGSAPTRLKTASKRDLKSYDGAKSMGTRGQAPRARKAPPTMADLGKLGPTRSSRWLSPLETPPALRRTCFSKISAPDEKQKGKPGARGVEQKAVPAALDVDEEVSEILAGKGKKVYPCDPDDMLPTSLRPASTAAQNGASRGPEKEFEIIDIIEARDSSGTLPLEERLSPVVVRGVRSAATPRRPSRTPSSPPKLQPHKPKPWTYSDEDLERLRFPDRIDCSPIGFRRRIRSKIREADRILVPPRM